MPTRTRGALIVIEGLDRAGKSTQHRRAAVELQNQGLYVETLQFPDRTTPIGQSINAYLQGHSQVEDHVIHLLFSANRWEAAPRIHELIENGTTVLVDRYYYSGAVYSAAKQNPNLSLEWARSPDVGLPRPDLCLFLDLSPDETAKRGGFGNERYEKQEMQARVRALFHHFIKLPIEREDVQVVDASRSEDEVAQNISASINELMRGHRLKLPLRLIEAETVKFG